MKKVFLFLTMALLCISVADAKVKVHTIGDSTMSGEYDVNATKMRGWCMFLQDYLNEDELEVNNRGKAGADTRNFYTEPKLWASVKTQMSAGDFLIIQFAHNDEIVFAADNSMLYGMDLEEYNAYQTANNLPVTTYNRGTNPQTTFREYLRKFIDESRALGVTPILVGPICRKGWNNTKISRTARHDVGGEDFQGYYQSYCSKIENGILNTEILLSADDHSMDYVEAMRIVAKEKEIKFVDLTDATAIIYEAQGKSGTESLFVDATHLNEKGAKIVAEKAAELLEAANAFTHTVSDVPSVQKENIRIKKVIENGHFYIIRDNEKFNIDGRKVQ